MLCIRKMAHYETHNQQTQRNKNQALLRDARFSCLQDCSVSQRFQFSFSFANSVVVAGFHHSYCLVGSVVEVVNRGRGRGQRTKTKEEDDGDGDEETLGDTVRHNSVC